jgi:hypothetical protein
LVTTRQALADTSVFIELETAQFVLQAREPEASARRLSTYQLAQRFEPLAVDEAVSDTWALLVSRLRAEGRKAPINDSWIAATAIAHGVPIVTQDSGYDAMPGWKSSTSDALHAGEPAVLAAQPGARPGRPSPPGASTVA